MNFTRHMLAAVETDQYVHVLGGGVTNESGQILFYAVDERAPIQANDTLGEWTVIGGLNHARIRHAVVRRGDYVYILGGYLANPTYNRVVERARIQGDGTLSAWNDEANQIVVDRWNPAAVSVGDYLYLIAGWRLGDESLNSVERAHVGDNGVLSNWGIYNSLQYPRYASAAVVAGDHVYVIGGWSHILGTIGPVEVAPINPGGSLGSWSTTSSLVRPRYGLGAAADEQYIYAISGDSSEEGSDPSIERACYNCIHWRGNLASGERITITYQITVGLSFVHEDVITQTAEIVDAYRNINLDSITVTISTLPQLSLSKSVTPSLVGPGQDITYTLTITNSGGAAASNLVITDIIPSNATHVRGGTKIGNIVSWTVPSLAAKDNLKVEFVVMATQTITNSKYGVVADGDASAIGQQAVVAIVDPNGPPNSVRVLDEHGLPVAGAIIYRNGKPPVDIDDYPRLTNSQGVLTFTTLYPNNTLAALQLVYQQPTTKTAHNPDGGDNFAFRVYRTSMPVDNDGKVISYTVPSIGQPHILTVAPTNTLILFNVVASIEWNAGDQYIEQLKTGLKKASHMLYNATDGHMAFGWITIYDHKKHWDEADIRIWAHNEIRPGADVGGISTTGLSYKNFTPAPGQIRLGRYWDGKNGNAGFWDQNSGYATIAHEFAHYGLFLFDEYFYYRVVTNPDGSAYPVRTKSRCTKQDNDPASIMSNQYTKTEFCNRPEQYEPTFQTQVYGDGETSWHTIKGIYSNTLQAGDSNPPWLIISPPDRDQNLDFVEGPTQAPLDWLKIKDESDPAPASTKTITVLGGGWPVEAVVSVVKQTESITLYQGRTDQLGNIDLLGAATGDNICARTLDIGLGQSLHGCQKFENTTVLELSPCDPDTDCMTIGPGHKRGWTVRPQDILYLTSVDGNLTMYALTNTFATTTELVIVRGSAVLPKSPPNGTMVVGLPYSITATIDAAPRGLQAPGASIDRAEQAMALTLAYQPLSLGAVDEATLKPYRYNGQEWIEITTYTRDIEANEIHFSTAWFGLYALMGEILSSNKIYLPIIVK